MFQIKHIQLNLFYFNIDGKSIHLILLKLNNQNISQKKIIQKFAFEVESKLARTITSEKIATLIGLTFKAKMMKQKSCNFNLKKLHRQEEKLKNKVQFSHLQMSHFLKIK